MEKITGIRSVDFKITAKGHGVVNWNGPTKLSNDGKTVENHTMPKLKGYTNLSGKIKDETGYKYKKEAHDIDFKQTPLYISQNCIRHHLFKDHAYDLHFAKEKNLLPVLASITGLVRGYAVTSSQCKRASALLLEDFVDRLGNGNFEQFGRAGERDSSSFYSKTTFGDTEYESYGSICIEQLQFISLDNKFDRAAIKSTSMVEGKGEEAAQVVQDFIQTLDTTLKPSVVFHPNYVRKGTIYQQGEAGLLLNQDAIQALVEHTIESIYELSIRQARSYMYVDTVEVDYNDSAKMMRIKRFSDETSQQPQMPYAIYYFAK